MEFKTYKKFNSFHSDSFKITYGKIAIELFVYLTRLNKL